jgi:hypothetical protein
MELVSDKRKLMEVMMDRNGNQAEILGKNLRRMRVMAGFGTREDMALSAGIDPEAARNLEKGRLNQVSLEDLSKVLDTLKLNDDSRQYVRSVFTRLS